MRKIFSALVASAIMASCNDDSALKSASETAKDSSVTTSSGEKPQSEFADAKYIEMGKRVSQQFGAGDIDSWKNNFSDNVVYLWSAGDSIVGKEAIANYWKDRWKNHVDSLTLSNDIWLPIKVNRPQQGPDVEGVWLLNWHMVHAKYKTGKSLAFWVHIDYHFDANDKIDRAISYVDRAPINAATKK
ncbi:MAG: nuclear transport factor 2 family protein [Chitinophagaceae bacterium]|nr:nuclear transport factor 2 family protein [Chitinophagaceae bacterium]